MTHSIPQDLHAIVLGGHVAALGVVRALAGIVSHCEVWDRTPQCIARVSRYVDRFWQIDILSAPTLVEALIERASVRRLTLVFPTDDLTTAVLSQHYDRLTQHGLVPVADRWHIVQKFCFKDQTYQLASEIGLPHPRTIVLDDRLRHDLNYPMLLKPTVMETFNRKFHRKVVVCISIDDLRASYERFRSHTDEYQLLAQEIIPGPARNLYSFGMIRMHDRLLGGIAARRKRQYPIDYGSASTFVETCDIAHLEEYSVRIIEAARYNGICEVEFKFDQRDGQLKLLEVNPRLWKWHALSLQVGLNFAALFAGAVLGKNTETVIVTSRKKQAAWRDVFSDMLSLWHERRAGNMTATEMLREVLVRPRDSVFQATDLRPFFHLVRLLPRLVRGGRHAL